jgi:hypothetical protein
VVSLARGGRGEEMKLAKFPGRKDSESKSAHENFNHRNQGFAHNQDRPDRLVCDSRDDCGVLYVSLTAKF